MVHSSLMKEMVQHFFNEYLKLLVVYTQLITILFVDFMNWVDKPYFVLFLYGSTQS